MIETVEKIINDNKNDNSCTTSILLTGMGEPLLNYDEVIKFHKEASKKLDINELIPINKKYSILECLDACKYYHDKTNRKVSISYTLMDGVNDTDEHINKLISILDEDFYRIQLILYNENDKIRINRPTIERTESIKEKLIQAGFKIKVSYGNGRDIGAACGQLFV